MKSNPGRPFICLLPSLLIGSALGQSVVVGITAPGSTSYPNGSLGLMDTLPLPGDRIIRVVMPDPTAGVVYTASDALPGAIHQRDQTTLESLQILRLPVEADRVVGLAMPPGENRILALTAASPARLAGFRSTTMELESLTAVPGATGMGRALAVDPRNGRLVIVTAAGTTSTRVGLIDPVTAGELASRVLPFASNEQTAVLVDPANDSYHICLGGITARLFRLSSTDLTINQEIYIGATSFSINRPILINGRVHAVRSNFPAQLVSLNAADYGSLTTRTFPAGTSSANAMAWDSESGEIVLGYLGSGQVRVGRFDPDNASLVASRVLTADNQVPQALAVLEGSVLVGRIGSGAARLARFDGGTLEHGSVGHYRSMLGSSSAAASDPAAGVHYLGVTSSPAQVLKLDAGTGDVRGEVIATNAAAQQVQRLAIDRTRGEVYALLGSAPASILRMSINPFAETGWLSLTGVTASQAFAHDESAGFIYTVSNAVPSRIVRISLADFSTTTFATLGSGDTNVNGLLLDRTNGWLYAMTNTSPGRIARVRLSDFTHDETLILTENEAGLLYGMVDATATTGYFATLGSPMRVARVRLSDFTHQGTLAFQTGENNMRSLASDGSSDRVWFSLGTILNQGNIVGMRQEDFARDSGVSLTGSRSFAGPLVADPGRGFIVHYPQGMSAADRFHVAPNNQLHASRVEITQGGWLTDIQIYSHLAGRPIRLALYREGNPRALVAESNQLTTIDNGTLSFATEPLTIPLEPGSYWLAWQSPASTATVGRHPGDGSNSFSTARAFGQFPASITNWEAKPSSSRWAQSFVYTLDLEPPVLESVSMTTSNPSGTHARPGDSITFTMTSSKDLRRLTATVGGVAEPANGVAKNWTHTRVLGEGLPEGGISFELLARDLVGNESTTTALVSGNPIIFDSIPPTPFVTGPLWKVTGAIPLNLAANESLSSARLYVRGSGSDDWELVPDFAPLAGYSPPEKGIWHFAAQATDIAGNQSALPQDTTPSGAIRVLYNTPANSAFTQRIGIGDIVGPTLFPMTDSVLVRVTAKSVSEAGDITISRQPQATVPASLDPSQLRLDALDVALDSSLRADAVVLRYDADPLAAGIPAENVTHVYTRIDEGWQSLPAVYDAETGSIQFSPTNSGLHYFGTANAIRPVSSWGIR